MYLIHVSHIYIFFFNKPISKCRNEFNFEFSKEEISTKMVHNITYGSVKRILNDVPGNFHTSNVIENYVGCLWLWLLNKRHCSMYIIVQRNCFLACSIRNKTAVVFHPSTVPLLQ